ncbi:hypothetical protein [Dactylosporangium sp. CA-233914]|uniref:hypothetical protein n=1 Tax=Dactylosporangium sp. CA-233914 TaxID=3239934 RepID=UPI003D8C643D
MYDMPHVPEALRPIVPWSLTWPEVDPARHPFDAAAAPALVRSLPPAADVPARPAGSAANTAVIQWGHGAAKAWADAMSAALVGHYGRWACGWRWATGEGDFDGGPVHAWCCPRDSMPAPQAALDAVAAGLLEWRSWLEDLAGRFGRFLPVPAGAGEDEVLGAWERAVAHLVTAVVERTGADSGWYTHCRQVLGWFLAAAGIPAEQHTALLGEAIGGRFHSWLEPEPPVVADVSGRLARTMAERGRA